MGTLRHDTREISTENAQDKSFDSALSAENWDLSPNGLKGASASQRYKYMINRVNEIPHMKRKDLVRGASWCIHLPNNIRRGTPEEAQFFRECVTFLKARYGEANCFSAVVHRDERNVDGSLSRPHLHYKFIPTKYDDKRQEMRISYDKCISRTEYRVFHPELKKYLESRGIRANVNSGITRRQGGNRSIERLRDGYARDHARERTR